MRQQFERDSEAWENAVPANVVLKKLEDKLNDEK